MNSYCCGEHQHSENDLVIYRIAIGNAGSHEFSRRFFKIVGIYLLAPYKQDIEANETSDMCNTATRHEGKTRFCVEQTKARMARNEDHRYLVSQLGLVKHSCMECKASNTNKGETLIRRSALGYYYE